MKIQALIIRRGQESVSVGLPDTAFSDQRLWGVPRSLTRRLDQSTRSIDVFPLDRFVIPMGGRVIVGLIGRKSGFVIGTECLVVIVGAS